MITYKYITLSGNEQKDFEYIEFLRKFHGDNAITHYKRSLWYQGRGYLDLLVALEDGEYVGQSSAYKVQMHQDDSDIDWWWGVDTFVLPKMRGKGVGKTLQKKLHEEHPNFSSLWYSGTNGIIKRKCGATTICKVGFNFYPIKSFFSVLLRAGLSRFAHKDVTVPSILKHKYLFAYKSRCLNVSEISLETLLEDMDKDQGKCFSRFNFYVKRDHDYLAWKYGDNPSLNGYHIYSVSSINSSETEGIIILTEPYIHNTLSVDLKVMTVLDIFVFNHKLKESDILGAVVNNINLQGIEGIISLGRHFKKFSISFEKRTDRINLPFPFEGMELLSNYKGETSNIQPYFSYSDQDMEQMI